MVKKLARTIIKQFIGIVEKLSQKCCCRWDKCAIKFVSRQYIDRLVIEVVYKKNSCNLDVFLPSALVTIDFTDIKARDLDNPIWIEYLERTANELLLKLSENRDKLIPNTCCLPEHKCVPVNKCNATYREEYDICCPPCPPCKPQHNSCDRSESDTHTTEHTYCNSEDYNWLEHGDNSSDSSADTDSDNNALH